MSPPPSFRFRSFASSRRNRARWLAIPADCFGVVGSVGEEDRTLSAGSLAEPARWRAPLSVPVNARVAAYVVTRPAVFRRRSSDCSRAVLSCERQLVGGDTGPEVLRRGLRPRRSGTPGHEHGRPPSPLARDLSQRQPANTISPFWCQPSGEAGRQVEVRLPSSASSVACAPVGEYMERYAAAVSAPRAESRHRTIASSSGRFVGKAAQHRRREIGFIHSPVVRFWNGSLRHQQAARRTGRSLLIAVTILFIKAGRNSGCADM